MCQCWRGDYVIMLDPDKETEGQKNEELAKDTNSPNLLNILYSVVPKAGLEPARA